MQVSCIANMNQQHLNSQVSRFQWENLQIIKPTKQARKGKFEIKLAKLFK